MVAEHSSPEIILRSCRGKPILPVYSGSVPRLLRLNSFTSGPLFRSINRHGQVQVGRLSDIDVARIVKKLVERAGLDAAKYAGHSLRAGHATSAAIGGASERSIMNQTGHRSVQMVRRYIRDGSLLRKNSAGCSGGPPHFRPRSERVSLPQTAQ